MVSFGANALGLPDSIDKDRGRRVSECEMHSRASIAAIRAEFAAALGEKNVRTIKGTR